AFGERVVGRARAGRRTGGEVCGELLHGSEEEVRVPFSQSRDLRDYAPGEGDEPRLRNRAAVEAHTKLRSVLDKVDDILAAARRGGRPTQTVESLRREIAGIEQEMLARL